MKTLRAMILFLICLALVPASDANPDQLGQTIQIYTRFRSFIGKPTWLLVIRDLDHNQNIPYLFDIRQKTNFWIAFTYGRNYLITASTLQFSPYKSNPYTQRVIRNFCYLESNGRIIRGQSIVINIDGALTSNRDAINCSVSFYSDANFTITSAE